MFCFAFMCPAAKSLESETCALRSHIKGRDHNYNIYTKIALVFHSALFRAWCALLIFFFSQSTAIVPLQTINPAQFPLSRREAVPTETMRGLAPLPAARGSFAGLVLLPVVR